MKKRFSRENQKYYWKTIKIFKNKRNFVQKLTFEIWLQKNFAKNVWIMCFKYSCVSAWHVVFEHHSDRLAETPLSFSPQCDPWPWEMVNCRSIYSRFFLVLLYYTNLQIDCSLYALNLLNNPAQVTLSEHNSLTR